MGLFDRFKKPADGKPAAGKLLDALKERYSLKKTAPPPDASLMQDWWECRLEGKLLAFDEPRPGAVVAFLGEIVEVTSIYLTRSAPGKEFRLAAGVADADAPKLELLPIRDGLARLSAAVQEVAIYENDRGLSLRFGAAATPETIAADLAIAQGMLRAL